MSNKPNFLFIITDQHKFDHLGCYGNSIVKTPNIDSISEQGLTFDQFYVASPICMPNRATLMTGRMPAQHRVWLNGIPLSKQNVTFVDLLRKAGYKTGLVGKCHLQPMMDIELPESRFWPEKSKRTEENDEVRTVEDIKTAVTEELNSPEYDQERAGIWRDNPTHEPITPYYGFDYVRFANFHADMVHGHYRRWLEERHPNSEKLQGPQNALKNHSYSVKKGWRTQMPEELYPTTYITEETISFLNNHVSKQDEEPFFLQVSFPDPHAPLTPPGRYWDLYNPDEVELPDSFEHVDTVEPLFVQKIRESHGSPKKVPAPITPDEKEAREMIALTYGSISMIDDAIGKILAALDELSLTENTIVIFTADHGDMGGDHGLFGKFGIHYEAVLKVPFIWKDPEKKQTGRVDQLGGTIDIGSSILARADVANVYGTQGFDIVSLSQAKQMPSRNGIFIEEDQLSEQVNGLGSQRIWTYIFESWRLSIWLGDEVGHLFDRSNDPQEMNNLWQNPDYAAKKAELTEMMLRERMRLADTLPLTSRFA